MNIPPLPSLSDVKKAIDTHLASMDWSRHREAVTPEDFLKQVNTSLGILQKTFILLVKPNMPASSQRFYRLRIAEQPLNDGLISEFGPPPPAIAGFDRCSIKHHPVMYCSANPATTFQETLQSRQESKSVLYGYLSEWKIREGALVNITPFMFNELPEESDLKVLVRNATDGLVNLLSRHYDEDQIAGVIETMKYLCTMFTYDNTRSISSYIAHTHLYANAAARPDMLLYPSIRAGLRRGNFAIHPNSIFKLEMTKVFCIEIRNFKSLEKEFELAWFRERHNHGGVLDIREITEARGEQLTNELKVDFRGVSG